jgi:hypothetical protein
MEETVYKWWPTNYDDDDNDDDEDKDTYLCKHLH